VTGLSRWGPGCRWPNRWRAVVRIGRISLIPALTLLALTSCDRLGADRDRHPDWVIHSRLVFLTQDLRGELAPLPLTQFRLLFPYIAGDLYGAPTTGDFINATLGADYRFEIDLNRSHKPLLASLEPTEFSLSYLRIEPAEARMARLAPMAMQADGIEQVGRTDWVDPDSRRPLLLLFLDRAANITGRTTARGRAVRYDIRVGSAGYVWVAQQTDAQGDVYTVVPRPARLVLAVTPLTNGPPTTASPAGRDIPAR
jgi:hypothetical protein